MRMEGKNLLLKRAAQTSNFKNVPYTVAKRHQRLLCAYLQGQNFFDTTLECGPGIYIFMRVFVARCMDCTTVCTLHIASCDQNITLSG